MSLTLFGGNHRLLGAGYTTRLAQWMSRFLIKSIQRGSITIANGQVSGTATITAVVPGNVELIYLGETHDASEANNSRRRSTITVTNATTITATRQGNGGIETVLFEAREYWPGVIISVQRGTVGNTTASINAVDVTHSTINQLGWSTSATDGDCGASATLTNSTTVTGVTQGSGTVSGYQVIWWAF